MKTENKEILLTAVSEMHATWLRGKNAHNQLAAIRRKHGVQSGADDEQFSLSEDKDGKLSGVKSSLKQSYEIAIPAEQQAQFGSGTKKALAFFYALNRTMKAAGGSADVLFSAYRMEAESKAAEGRKAKETEKANA